MNVKITVHNLPSHLEAKSFRATSATFLMGRHICFISAVNSPCPSIPRTSMRYISGAPHISVYGDSVKPFRLSVAVIKMSTKPRALRSVRALIKKTALSFLPSQRLSISFFSIPVQSDGNINRLIAPLEFSHTLNQFLFPYPLRALD